MFSAMSLTAMFSPLTLCRYVLPLACALVLSPSFAAEASDGTEDGALDADAMGDQGLARANSFAAARPHFMRGVELYRAGAYDASLAAFTRAYERAPSYRLIYNLAQVKAQRQD